MLATCHITQYQIERQDERSDRLIVSFANRSSGEKQACLHRQQAKLGADFTQFGYP